MQKINVTRSSMPDMEEYINEIAPLWDSRWLTNMGVKHNESYNCLQTYFKLYIKDEQGGNVIENCNSNRKH